MPFLGGVFSSAALTGYALFLWLLFAAVMLPFTEYSKWRVRRDGTGSWWARNMQW